MRIDLGVVFMVDTAVGIYLQIVNYALPVAVVFELGNLIVNVFLRMAFRGRIL